MNAKSYQRYLSYVLLAAMFLSILPPSFVYAAAPTSSQQAKSNAPNACPTGPASLPNIIERTDFCVYFDGGTTNAQATIVADQTQQYWDRYVALNFREPLVLDGKLEVRIQNAGCNGGTGASINFIDVNNGCFSVDGWMQKVVGHELFHRVQYSYDGSEVKWFKEGSARAMEDKAFANIDNWPQASAASSSYNNEVNDYLVNTNVDITSEAFKYEAALWWTYFMEQFGSDPDEPELGVDAMNALWDAAETADDIAAVNAALGTLGAGTDFNAAFRKFTAANWLKDYAGNTLIYDYIDEDQAGNPMPYGPIAPKDGGTINLGNLGNSAIWNSQSISRYGADYYRASIGSSCPVVNATLNTISGPSFFHVMTANGSTLDYFESSTAGSWTRSFYNDGIDEIVAIAGSTSSNATVDVTLQCFDPQIDLKQPNNGAVANVGSFDGLGKFLAQVLVTDGSPTGPVIDGLTINDFKASVNGVEALVTTGGFIQEQYWLVIQAPVQSADGVYDLEVRLEESGTTTVIATDSNPASIAYTPENIDQLLVLDRSGSMNSDGKFIAAQNAANFYIDITRNNNGLGVIPYHTGVDPVPFPLQNVTTVPNVRANAENYVDALNTGNLTSIGDGLGEAANQRNASPTSNPLCSFVLLSDGIETADLYWDDVKADVIATGCPVTTIAFGESSDETLMQNIATETGGLFFYNDVFVSANALSAASVDGTSAATTLATMNLSLGDTYEYAQAQGEGRVRLLHEMGTVPILQSEFELPPDQIHKVFIDESVDHAVFSLDWHSINEPDCDNSTVSNGCFGKDLALKLIKPDGKEIDPAQLDYSFEDIVSGHVGWRVANPMPGEWTLVVNADSFYVWYDIPYQVIVSGPSMLTAELLLPDRVGSRYSTGNRVPIHAFISSDQPVSGAVAIADVTSPIGIVSPVRLYDDGRHNDGRANDGFYAGIYKQVNQATRVNDQNGEDGGIPFREPLDEGAYRVRLRVTLGEIQREALGSFSVKEGADLNLNGIPDNYEAENGIKSATDDADLDGLDAGSEYQLGTDPNNSDTDGSGENDGSEFNKGQNVLHPRDDKINAPEYLSVSPNVGFNEITYHVRPEYARLILYRAPSPKGPWTLVNSELPREGRYEDMAENDVTYYYRYLGINENQHGSAIIDSTPVTPSKDPFPPEAIVQINDGAPTTGSLEVELSFVEDVHGIDEAGPEQFEDIVEMKISNDPKMGDAEWQPFSPKVAWMLAETELDEIAKVYVQFRDAAGNESIINTDAIRYVEKYSGLPIPVDAVDQTLHRRVAQLLEEMRNSPMAPGWSDARVADEVTPFFRPDVEGPAYYEFMVTDGNGADLGFVMLSTGEHDFPIAHWSYSGMAPSKRLAQQANDAGKTVSKFYKLDTLAYGAENRAGERVGYLGNEMLKISGLPTNLLDSELGISASEWAPDTEIPTDAYAEGFVGTKKESGPQPLDGMVRTEWASWQEMKDGYAESYGLFTEMVRRDAAGEWAIDTLAERYGEGLQVGDVYDLSLLYPGDAMAVELTGEGSAEAYLKTELITNEGLPSVLRMTVLAAEAGKELPLTVQITYGDEAMVQAAAIRAATETLTFAIIEPNSVEASGDHVEPDTSTDPDENIVEVLATPGPTTDPTAGPTAAPTTGPTAGPTAEPTVGPTVGPTTGPTVAPTAGPTSEPTPVPTTMGQTGETKIFLPSIIGSGSQQVSAANVANVQAQDGAWSAWNYFWAGSNNDQRLYDQIPESHAINTSSCWSGCGGTAWAMLFGWADKQAATGNAYWSPRWGLYRENGGKGADDVAPREMGSSGGVYNMTWEIRNDVDTFCAGDSGPTTPWDMDEASGYLKDRSGTKLDTHYNVAGIHESRLREYARDSIIDRDTPAIIGTGWLTHYPLAYGYAWRKRTVKKCFIFCWNETEYSRWFYVNQGWGDEDDLGWVSAGTWFAGEIRP